MDTMYHDLDVLQPGAMEFVIGKKQSYLIFRDPVTGVTHRVPLPEGKAE